MARFDALVFLSDFLEDTLPKVMCKGHRVGLVAHADTLQPTLPGIFERMPNDTLHAFPRVDVLLHCDLIPSAFFEETTHADIKPFRVLAKDHEFHVRLFPAAQGCQSLMKQFYRPCVDIKVELKPQSEQNVRRVL